jgi:hypothetical protein
MKKLVVSVLLILCATTVFSQNVVLSAGGGVSFTPLIGDYQKLKSGSSSGTIDGTMSAFGIKGFFDATYAVASLGWYTNVSNVKVRISSGGTTIETDFAASISFLEFRLLGKYPFSISGISVFPLLGLQFTPCLGGKFDNVEMTSDDKANYSDWTLLFGVGADFKATDKIFVRPLFLIGYVLTTKNNDASYDLFAPYKYDSSSGWIFELGVSVGYIF